MARREGKVHPGMERVFVVFDYSQPEVKKLIKAVKYRFYKGVIEELLQDTLLDEKLVEAEVIVPIPLHRRRQDLRGFKQA